MAMEQMLGQLKVTQRLSEYEFGVELWVIREGINRNNWDYRNIEQYYQTFLGTPILCAYVGGKVGDGHNMKERKDENGVTYYSFVDGTSERIVGTLSADPEDLRIEEVEGQKWLVAKGRLFAFYARELVEKIVNTGMMEVSAETEVFESYQDGKIEVFTDWAGLGVTILGDGVAPAVPNARIEELRAMQEEFNGLVLKAASLQAGEELAEDPIEEETMNSNPTKKGLNDLKDFSKKQIAELAVKFPNHTVLGACEDENGIHICLMSADGTSAICTLGSMEQEVTEAKIVKCNAKVCFEFDDELKLYVDSADMTDAYAAKIVALTASLEKANADLESANSTISAMNEVENRRRVQAAKAKASAVLGEFNANREDAVSETVLESINADIDNGVYTNSVNENGDWVGEDAVSKMVLAACASEVMKMDKAIADKNKTMKVWDKVAKDSADDGSINGLIAKLKKR